jgi:threonine/homoserine/homoserine lactone efflux protein
MRDIVRNRVVFAVAPAQPSLSAGNPGLNQEQNQAQKYNFDARLNHPLLSHPLVAGIFVSMSNPYWWGWWASAGLGLMVQLKISFGHWPGLLAFFLGHETGDFLWYILVSVLVYHSRHWLTERLYKIVLLVCSVVMISFGLYLGIKPFVSF